MFPNIPNPFDPTTIIQLFTSVISTVLQQKINDLANFFEDFLVHPVRPPEGSVTDWLYGNAIGLAGYLVITLAIVGIILAWISPKAAIRGGKAFLLAVIAVPMFTVFFQLCDGMIQASDAVTGGIVQISKTAGSGPLIAPPSITDLFWAGIGFIGIGASGGALVVVMIAFALLIVAVKFLFLPALVLDPWLGKARGILEWCMSIGFIAMFASRPVAAFCITLGRLLAAPAHSVAITVIAIIAGIILAFAAQFVLVKKTRKIVGDVMSRARSQVYGKVETINRPINQTNMQQVQNIHMAGMRSPQRPTRTQATGLAVRQHLHHRSVVRVTKMIGKTSNPGLQVALKVYRQAKINRPPVMRNRRGPGR